MSKRKVDSSRLQLPMLLPITSKPVGRSMSTRSFVGKSETGKLVRMDEHRRAALKNLEKSGLRSRTED